MTMDSNTKTLYSVRYLLSKSLDNNITAREAEYLDQLILSNPQARQYYVEILQVHTHLRRLHEKEAVLQNSDECNLLDMQLWEELAHYELTAEAMEVEEECKEVEMHSARLVVLPEKRKPNKFSLFSLVSAIAAVLIMALFLRFMPVPKIEVATLTDCMNCQWEGKVGDLKKGDHVLNEPLKLLSGFVTLTFDYGAEVVVEGPAEFTPLSADKMILQMGKAFAHVPNKAIGFTIDTPSSCVVDLGTNFGVQTLADGSSEVHVFEGKVNLIAGSGEQPKASEILTRHQARKTETGTAMIKAAEFKEYQFAQKISSKENCVVYGRPVSLASLADLVMGGNGHGTSQEKSEIYAVSTGQKITDPTGQYRTINNPYQKVSSNTFIDGIFVPNGKNQVVSSEGHVFAECPATTGFYYYHLCFDKNWKYAPSVAELYQKQRNLNFTPDVVFMHSNIGVTFNLDAVRRQFPGQSIRRLQGTVGTLFSFRGFAIMPAEQLTLNYTEFDVWIVVDGQLRTKAERVHWDSLIGLDVPLAAGDRFLSIVVTDGGIIRSPGNNENHYDSCGLADMRFEMESTK